MAEARSKAYSFAKRDQAEELYVEQDLTYEQVSERLGVAVPTLKQWSKKYDWTEKRLDYRNAGASLKASLIKLRQSMIEKAIRSLKPQDVFAVSSIVNAMKTVASVQAAEDEEAAFEPREIRTAGDAIDALQEAINRKLQRMLGRPEIVDLKAVKEVKEAMTMVDDMKKSTEAAPEEGRKKKLDPEVLRAIREEVYGLV